LHPCEALLQGLTMKQIKTDTAVDEIDHHPIKQFQGIHAHQYGWALVHPQHGKGVIFGKSDGHIFHANAININLLELGECTHRRPPHHVGHGHGNIVKMQIALAEAIPQRKIPKARLATGIEDDINLHIADSRIRKDHPTALANCCNDDHPGFVFGTTAGFA
jgi:hypothetical protein